MVAIQEKKPKIIYLILRQPHFCVVLKKNVFNRKVCSELFQRKCTSLKNALQR